MFILKVSLAVALISGLYMGDTEERKDLHAAVTAVLGDEAQEHLMISQLEEGKATKKKTVRSSEHKEVDSETKTTSGDKDKSSKSESKRLKRFEPSEKIEPEQAVDFPWDI